MQRLDLYCHSYGSFLRSKREGESSSQIAYGLRNIPWLESLTTKSESLDGFRERLAAWRSAKAASEAASSQIVRKSFM